MIRDSCDISTNKWSKGELAIEPGAKEVYVLFFDRTEHKVCKVDRDKKGKPWIKDENNKRVQEIFYYPNGDDLRKEYKLTGYGTKLWVDKVQDF